MAGMKVLTRRTAFVALLIFAACVELVAALRAQVHASESPSPAQSTQPAQTPVRTMPAYDRPEPPVAAASGGTMGVARVIPYDQMPAHALGSGGESRAIANGTLATGESVNLHQSMQPAGAAPAAPHVIQHSEFICVREGQLEFQHEVAGKMVSEIAGPGSVIYVAFGTRHAVKNVGTVPARYFVIAIGGDAK